MLHDDGAEDPVFDDARIGLKLRRAKHGEETFFGVLPDLNAVD